MQILSQRQYITETYYELFYQWQDSTPGHGMGFACDENGKVDMVALEKKPAALDNYNKCLNGTHAVKAPTIQKFQHSYSQPAIGKCDCGCEVQLDSFTNTCDHCNRDYNMSGQLLAPRCQWGEETGESFCDLQDL